MGHELLRMAKALGIGAQRRHGGIDLLGGVRRVGHEPRIGGTSLGPYGRPSGRMSRPRPPAGIIGFRAMRLMELSHGAGCGCKLPAAKLAPIVAGLPVPTDPRVLVDASTSDDAAVFKLPDALALVPTAYFCPPIVDDPYLFGRIAATNALSDVYAMGATPLTAINLVAFPLETLGAG